MKISSVILGIIATLFLLVVLALVRFLVTDSPIETIEIRDIEITTLEEPPPPLPEEPPVAPPPPPALTELADLPDPARVPVPKATVPMDLTMAIDPFHTESVVAPLPTPVIATPRPTPAPRPTPKTTPTPKPTPKPPKPPAQSTYNLSNLDSVPRLIRHGKATFPAALARRGVTEGRVVLEVELSTAGTVTVRRVISSTHRELIDPAQRVARASRYTAPKKNGLAVKAIMRWPITIKKP